MKNRKKTLITIWSLSIIVILSWSVLIWDFIVPLFQWYMNADDIWAAYEEDYGYFQI